MSTGPIQGDGANIISSQIDRIVKKGDGTIEYHPAEGESVRFFNPASLINEFKELIKPVNYAELDKAAQVRQEKAFNKAFGSFMERLTEEQKKEFKENPVDFLRNHPELRPKTDATEDVVQAPKPEEE